MLEFLLDISPIILLTIIGFILKSYNFFNKSHADLFLKVVFYIAVPGLIFSSFDQLKMNNQLIYLPLFSSLILLLTFGISYTVGTKLNLPRATLGTFVLGSSIMNTGFALPFILTLFGNTGVAYLMIFDLGNVGLVLTLLYYFACRMGSNKYNSRILALKLVTSTPLLALGIAIFLNLSDLHLPKFLLDLSNLTGLLVIPLIMLALGIYFNPKIIRAKLVVIVVFIRMGIGFFIGMIISYIFNLEGLEKIITVIGTSAPIGYNTLTFASLENLDKEFAATLVSVAIGIGIFSVPILLFFLSN